MIYASPKHGLCVSRIRVPSHPGQEDGLSSIVFWKVWNDGSIRVGRWMTRDGQAIQTLLQGLILRAGQFGKWNSGARDQVRTPRQTLWKEEAGWAPAI